MTIVWTSCVTVIHYYLVSMYLSTSTSQFLRSTSDIDDTIEAIMTGRWIRRVYSFTLLGFVLSFMYLYVSFEPNIRQASSPLSPSSSITIVDVSTQRRTAAVNSPPNLLTGGGISSNTHHRRHANDFRPLYSLKRSSYSPEIIDPQSTTIDRADELLDLKNFTFLLNSSETCQTNNNNVPQSAINLLAFVHTSVDNFSRRQMIRQTWASRETQSDLNIRVIFLTGIPNFNQSIQQHNLLQESSQFGDIVQGNFVDSYRNLTYKHLMGFKWVLKFCRKANFVMKIDDDAFVDIYRVIHLLGKTFSNGNDDQLTFNHVFEFNGHHPDAFVGPVYHDNHVEKSVHHQIVQQQQQSKSQRKGRLRKRPSVDQPTDVLACSMFPAGVKVKRYGKWKLSPNDYPFDNFPAYCSGIAYFASLDVIQDLYRASTHVRPFLWIDDLFITGILAAQFPIHHQPLNFKFTYSPSDLRNWLKIKQLQPSPHIIGDIGDVNDWSSLMTRLWEKTLKVWKG
ncbi:uncharacterized protein LOC141848920 [Brevipalpus obovatus]|uniref:uncharacterized protein LOC141848920 n=1 Tax=Brevipalpus obovatus TaxID=246614 RepID=UPI003D9EF578